MFYWEWIHRLLLELLSQDNNLIIWQCSCGWSGIESPLHWQKSLFGSFQSFLTFSLQLWFHLVTFLCTLCPDHPDQETYSCCSYLLLFAAPQLWKAWPFLYFHKMRASLVTSSHHFAWIAFPYGCFFSSSVCIDITCTPKETNTESLHLCQHLQIYKQGQIFQIQLDAVTSQKHLYICSIKVKKFLGNVSSLILLSSLLHYV